MKFYLILIIFLVFLAFLFRGQILNFYGPNLTKEDIEQIALEVAEKNFVSDEHIQKIATAVVEKNLSKKYPPHHQFQGYGHPYMEKPWMQAS